MRINANYKPPPPQAILLLMIVTGAQMMITMTRPVQRLEDGSQLAVRNAIGPEWFGEISWHR